MPSFDDTALEKRSGALSNTLIGLGIESKNSTIFPYPKFTLEQKRQMTFPLPFNNEELQEELARIKGWKVREFPFHDTTPTVGVIIEKHYTFDSFETAMKFMNKVS